MLRSIGRQAALLAVATLATVDSAAAHHLMGGVTPSTFAQGLLSGLGHPIIGLDHLAFLIAVGVVIGVSGLNLMIPAFFVAASAIGVALHVQGVSVPATEFVVAISVLAVGAIIARGASFKPIGWAGLFSVAGLFHGYAYGESIFGAETTPLSAYLLGLVLIQTALTTSVTVAVRRHGVSALAMSPRLVGAAVAGIGLAVLGAQILPA